MKVRSQLQEETSKRPPKSPVRKAVDASKHAEKVNTPEAHGEAEEHWAKLAKGEKVDWMKDAYSLQAKHHFNRSYGKKSNSPHRFEAKHIDRLPGGMGDNAKPSDFDPKEVKMGVKVEMEHTNDRALALEICLDHLSEDPRYYSKLKKIHKEDVMNIIEAVGWLEQLKESLLEAAPPPISPAARKAAGMKPLSTPRRREKSAPSGPPPIPSRRAAKPSDDTSKALAGLRRISKAKAAETDKAVLARIGQASSKISPEKRLAQARRIQIADMEKAKRAAETGSSHGTRGMGIRRGFKAFTATPGKDSETKAGVASIGRVVKKRASIGAATESLGYLARRVLAER